MTDWLPFLQAYSRELLATSVVKKSLPEEVLESGWMGYPGASAEQIQAAERRLGATFPTSLREFYLVSNGWRCAGFYSNGVFPYEILPVEKVEWFRTHNQEWIDIYAAMPMQVADKVYFVYGDEQYPELFRHEYLKTALEISTVHDAGVYLLNPKIVFADGEWEAWHLASWLPGASRYQSFYQLIVAERNTFRELLRNSQGR